MDNEEMTASANDPTAATRKTIGAAIRAARESKGYRIRELAEKCDLSKNQIVRIEMGRDNYTIDSLTKIAAQLGITISIS